MRYISVLNLSFGFAALVMRKLCRSKVHARVCAYGAYHSLTLSYLYNVVLFSYLSFSLLCSPVVRMMFFHNTMVPFFLPARPTYPSRNDSDLSISCCSRLRSSKSASSMGRVTFSRVVIVNDPATFFIVKEDQDCPTQLGRRPSKQSIGAWLNGRQQN